MALKIGRFYEQPVVYVIMLLFSIFLMLDNYYNRAGQVILGLSAAGAILYIIRHLAGKRQITVNSVKDNTQKSFTLAVVGLGLTVLISIILGGIFFGWSTGAIGDFLKYNKAAVIGAPVSPFANNPFVEFIIFVIAFPITETILFIQLYDLLLLMFGVQVLSFKDLRVWLATVPMTAGVIAYHVYAKSIATGKPNENVLMVIGVLFFIELMLVVYSKEMEPAILHHMINNALALGIVGYIALLTNWLTILVVIGALIVYYSKTGRNLLKKWDLAT